jgi:hypothetical protein
MRNVTVLLLCFIFFDNMFNATIDLFAQEKGCLQSISKETFCYVPVDLSGYEILFFLIGL